MMNKSTSPYVDALCHGIWKRGYDAAESDLMTEAFCKEHEKLLALVKAWKAARDEMNNWHANRTQSSVFRRTEPYSLAVRPYREKLAKAAAALAAFLEPPIKTRIIDVEGVKVHFNESTPPGEYKLVPLHHE